MKAQAMGDNRASEYMKGKKTMEINPLSPVILDLKVRPRTLNPDPTTYNLQPETLNPSSSTQSRKRTYQNHVT